MIYFCMLLLGIMADCIWTLNSLNSNDLFFESIRCICVYLLFSEIFTVPKTLKSFDSEVISPLQNTVKSDINILVWVCLYFISVSLY